MSVRLKVLPGLANNEHRYNATTYVQEHVWVDGDRQYVVWWDVNREPQVAVRTLPDGEWEARNLALLEDDPLASPVDLDAHNVIVCATDPEGRLHVAGNMHGHPMRYVRMVEPHHLHGAWTSDDPPAEGLAGGHTYPIFVRTTAALHMLYRDGSTGHGDMMWQTWTGEAWDAPVKLLDGKASSEGAYINRVAVDGDAVHIACCWRSTSNANTNKDLSHVMSLDAGASWQSVEGDLLSLPITHATVPVIFPTDASGSGLLNQGGCDLDADGRPHITSHYYGPDGASRFLYLRWTGASWESSILKGSWSHRMFIDGSVPAGEVARPQIIASSSPPLILYRNEPETPENGLRLFEVGGTGRDAPLLDGDLGNFEPTFTRVGDTFHVLVTATGGSEHTGEPIGVLTFDLADVDAILDGEMVVPVEVTDFDQPPPPPPVDEGLPETPGVRDSRVRWFSADLRSGRIIAELPDVKASDVSRALGDVTSTSLSVPIPLSGPASFGPVAIQATEPGRTMIVCVVNNVPMWGAVVLRRKDQGGQLDVAVATLESYLDRRKVRDHTFEAVDQATIAAALVGDAQDTVVGGVELPGIGFTVDAPATGRLRDRTYNAGDRVSVLQRLTELSEVQHGPEWTIDLDWSDEARTRFTKIVRVRQRIGRASDNPKAIFETLSPADARYALDEDYSDGAGANVVQAYSTGQGDDQPESDVHAAIDPGWPAYERDFQPDSGLSVDALNDHAAADLQRQRSGVIALELQVRWDTWPRLGIDWRLGDDVAWEVVSHRHPDGLAGRGRVVGWTLDLQTERVTPVVEVAELVEGSRVQPREVPELRPLSTEDGALLHTEGDRVLLMPGSH